MRPATLLHRLPALAGAIVIAASLASAQEADLEGPITELQQRYEEAWTGGDIDALARLHTEDALLLPAEGGTHQGREAIRAYYEAAPQPETFEITSQRTERIGDAILDVGTFAGTLPEEAGGEAIEGGYVVIAREDGGELRVHRLVAFPTRQRPDQAREGPGQPQ